MGKDVIDARCGGSCGCVEVGAFGKETYILTGYFNLPKVLEITLHNGLDPRTGKQFGPHTGDPAEFKTFDELFAGLRAADQLLRGYQNPRQPGDRALYAAYMPAPFLSLLIDDCIPRGQGLSRRRGALQHHLYPGRWPGHDHRLPLGDQLPRL